MNNLPPVFQKRTITLVRVKRRSWTLGICAFLAGFVTVVLLTFHERLFSFTFSFLDFQIHRNVPPLSETQVYPIIVAASRKYNLPTSLLLAVISTESRFQNRARSPRGAMGLMQLTKETVKAFGVTNPYDPSENINAGAKYLSELIKDYDGRIELALAAYNAGPGTVSRFKGVPPYPETRNYIKRVLNEYRHREQLLGRALGDK